jgi:hypothetical protein
MTSRYRLDLGTEGLSSLPHIYACIKDMHDGGEILFIDSEVNSRSYHIYYISDDDGGGHASRRGRMESDDPGRPVV